MIVLGIALLLSSAWAQSCAPLHLVYARATTEPPTGMESATSEQFSTAASKSSNKGFGNAGISLVTELTKLIPNLSNYPVNYPASFTGCSSETKGIEDVISHITTQSKACPNQKFVLGGHSQGGLVTASSVEKMPKELLPKILAVTMFGAPPCPVAVGDRCKSYCNAGDHICATYPNYKAVGFCKKPSGKWIDVQPTGLPPMEESVMPVQERGSERVAEECSGDDVPEKGHQVEGGVYGSKTYGGDAFYTKAAACYIFKRLKSSGGA